MKILELAQGTKRKEVGWKCWMSLTATEGSARFIEGWELSWGGSTKPSGFFNPQVFMTPPLKFSQKCSADLSLVPLQIEPWLKVADYDLCKNVWVTQTFMLITLLWIWVLSDYFSDADLLHRCGAVHVLPVESSRDHHKFQFAMSWSKQSDLHHRFRLHWIQEPEPDRYRRLFFFSSQFNQSSFGLLQIHYRLCSVLHWNNDVWSQSTDFHWPWQILEFMHLINWERRGGKLLLYIRYLNLDLMRFKFFQTMTQKIIKI